MNTKMKLEYALNFAKERLKEMTALLISLRYEQDQNRMNCQIPRPRLNDEIRYAETRIELYSAIVLEFSEAIERLYRKED